MREKINQARLEDKYLARHLQTTSINQVWTNEEMRNYIAYVRKLIPIISNDVAKYFSEKFRKLTGRTIEEEKSHRLRGNIFRWAYAHSKFISVGKEDKNNNVKLTKKSIDFAFELMRHSFGLLDLISKEGFTRYEDIEEIPKKKEVNKYYIIKDIIDELENKVGKIIPMEDIVKEAEIKGVEIRIIEETIEKLKRNGDIFEPRRNFITKI